MTTDPIQSADHLPEPEGDEIAGGLRPLGGHLGKVMSRLQSNIEKQRAETQTREPEEKPEPLPLVDEEELAAIADPRERERIRYNKTCIYRSHPYALQRAQERSAELIAERKKLLHLPIIPQETRPAVNVISNSALFAVIQGKDRQWFRDENLSISGESQLRFTGEQLNQDDHDVFMHLVYLASQHELGEPITVSAHSLLKALGRGTSGKEHDQLKAEIDRLVKGTVHIKTQKFSYLGHLIDDLAQDEETKLLVYRANPLISKFFDIDRYTLINWEERKALKGKDLARWLQLELASHAHPFPMKIETIRQLSGSRTKELYSFRQKLKAALDELKTLGAIAAWHIDENDLVHVERTPSASQQRHLIRRVTKPRNPKP